QMPVTLRVMDLLGNEIYSLSISSDVQGALAFQVPPFAIITGEKLNFLFQSPTGTELGRFVTAYRKLYIAATPSPALVIGTVPGNMGTADQENIVINLPPDVKKQQELRVLISPSGRYAAAGFVSGTRFGFRTAHPGEIEPSPIYLISIPSASVVGIIDQSAGIDRAHFDERQSLSGKESFFVPRKANNDSYVVSRYDLENSITQVDLDSLGGGSYAEAPLMTFSGGVLAVGDMDGVADLFDSGVASAQISSLIHLRFDSTELSDLSLSCHDLTSTADTFPLELILLPLPSGNVHLELSCAFPQGDDPMEFAEQLAIQEFHWEVDVLTGLLVSPESTDVRFSSRYFHRVSAKGEWVFSESTIITPDEDSPLSQFTFSEATGWSRRYDSLTGAVTATNMAMGISRQDLHVLYYYSTRFIDEEPQAGYNIAVFGSEAELLFSRSEPILAIVPLMNSGENTQAVVAYPVSLLQVSDLFSQQWQPQMLLQGSIIHAAVQP
ncbi:hypothetical protein KJ865_17215, partial [Myxococcota bacterium]|nr:hypothetical protein [Myxococcota bacterium]